MSVSLSHSQVANQSDRTRSGWQLGVAHFRGFAITVCFLLMAAALGLTYLKKTIHNELRNRIVAEIDQRLENSPFDCQLGYARWTEGRGLSLGGVEFTDQRTGEVVVSCEHVYASSTFQLTDILSGKPTIDSLAIDKASIHCRKGASGAWTLSELMETLKCDDPALVLDCPIQIRNSTTIIDGSASGLGQSLTIRGIDCDHSLTGEHNHQHTFKGFLSSDLSNRLEFDVTIDHEAGVWTSTCYANRIDINDRLSSWLQSITGKNSLIESLRGQVSVNAGATGHLGSNETPLFEVIGRAANMQCLESSLPHQIHNGSFEFRIDNKENLVPRIRINGVRCRLGYGTAQGDLVIVDPLDQPRWRLVGSVNNFKLTERLVPWMTPNLQRAWHQFQPGGFVDATFDFQFAGGKIDKKMHSTIREGSFSWYGFPFEVSQCSGTMNLEDGDLSIDLKAVEAQQLITVGGKISNPGESWFGWLEGKCDGNIPINEKLLQAFDTRQDLARTLRRYNATGYVNGWGRIERLEGSPVVNKRFDINLRRATVRHESFDYPVYNVNGLILAENDKTEFKSFHGMNNNGEIECNGSWTLDHGLQLRFLANNVLLNDELRDALPANLQKTWRGVRPTGTVDLVDLDLHMIPGQMKPLVGVTVEIPQHAARTSSVNINPVWFPYEMRQVTGKFRFENQRIDIKDFAARHGRTTINAHATGAYDDSDWRIRFFELFGNNIVLDDSLRNALPPALAIGMDRMKFNGNLSMQGAIEISGAFDTALMQAETGSNSDSSYGAISEPQRPTANLGWQLNFGIAQASATIGVPITNASGIVRLNGRYAGGNVSCAGDIAIDSMMYRDIQVTSVRAPLSIDNNLIGIGSLAVTSNPQTKSPSATGRVFGGRVEWDGQFKFAGDNDFFVQAVLTDGKLDAFATETSMKQQDFSGNAYAGIRLQGDSTGAHSIRGNGYIQLRDARIYEVPVMLALLKVLRIKEPDRTAFDEGQMEFTVNGENIDFQKIELNGDTLSLIGQGTVTMNSEVDLDFYTMMGRNRWYIPVLTNLYHAGAKQVWWVQVDGTLEDPNTSHQMLPGLSESLKILFPEFANADQ